MRQIQLQWLPVPAVVERNVYTLFGSGEKQIRAPRIDSYRMDIIVRRKARYQFGPSLPKICRLEDVRREIVDLWRSTARYAVPASREEASIMLTVPQSGMALG